MGDRVRRFDGARWGRRKISPGGRVRWCGRWYRLDDSPADLSVEQYGRLTLTARSHQGHRPKYDGRMDGLVGLFYTYGRHSLSSADRVFLHSIVGAEWPGPSCVHGVFVWETFQAEPTA